MSNRDQQFIDSIGISIAGLSDIVKKTRQTVRKSIEDEKHLFSALDVMKICHYYMKDSIESCAFAKRIASRIYPEYSQFIFESRDNPSDSTVREFPLKGEFWIACGDFASFEGNYVSCYNQLVKVKEDPENVVVIFAKDDDIRMCERFVKTPHQAGRYTVRCDAEKLRYSPTMLFHSDRLGQVSMHIADTNGFSEVAPFDAARIKTLFKELGDFSSS